MMSTGDCIVRVAMPIHGITKQYVFAWLIAVNVCMERDVSGGKVHYLFPTV